MDSYHRGAFRDERYFEVLETVEEPEAIYEGKMGECIAVREIEMGRYIVVVYRELGKEDGFVITAFLTA